MGKSINKYQKMKVFALTVLVAVGASGFSSNRNACPTLQDAANAFESHFGTQIPDGAMDCLYGGDNCPWNSLEDFGADFESATGIQLPEPDQDVLDFVQEEFGVNPSDETIEMIEMCAADFLSQ